MNLLYMRARANRAHTHVINYRSIPKTNTKQYWRYAYKLIKEKKGDTQKPKLMIK